MSSAETARPGVGESCGGLRQRHAMRHLPVPWRRAGVARGPVETQGSAAVPPSPHAAGPRDGAPGVRSLRTCFLPGEGGKPRPRKKQEPCRLQAVPLRALGLPGATYSGCPRPLLSQCDERAWASALLPLRVLQPAGPLSPDPRGPCRRCSQGTGATLSSTRPASQRVREDTRS